MNRRTIFFCIVTGLFWFSLYGYVPIVSSYANDMLATGTMIGLIGGSYGFTQMVLRIPLGIMSDKIGKRKPFMSVFGSIISSRFVKRLGVKRLLMCTFSSMAITCFIKPMAPGLFWLFVLQIVSGLSGSLTFTTLMSLVIKNVPQARRASAMGLF